MQRITLDSEISYVVTEKELKDIRADERKKVLEEVFVLSKFHSVDIPVVYGDGTQRVEKYISLQELHLIMTEMKGE